jgi:NhaP-type Na+/H+ and K+/H+ antiporter
VPESLGWLLLLFGGLLLLALFLDDLASRIKLPGFLLVLLLGLLIDNNLNPGPGEAPPLLTLDQADHLAQLALVLVLFFGGITSNWQSMRPVLRPALRLATLGSLLTALILAAVVMVLQNLPLTAADVSLPLALFIGAMFCSTDASAVFAILRPLKRRLPPRLLDLLECESGFNDPIAVVLAGVALAVASGQGAEPSGLLVEVLRSFLLGAFLGFLGGKGAVLLLTRRSAGSASLMAVVGLALLMAVIGGSVLLGGSGLLAAYVMGLVLGTSPEIDQQALEESQAGFAKLAELLLFLCLGLVVEPTAVVQVLKWSLACALAGGVAVDAAQRVQRTRAHAGGHGGAPWRRADRHCPPGRRHQRALGDSHAFHRPGRGAAGCGGPGARPGPPGAPPEPGSLALGPDHNGRAHADFAGGLQRLRGPGAGAAAAGARPQPHPDQSLPPGPGRP